MEKRMKGRHASFIAHHSSRVTRHGFYYRSPVEYLTSVGFIPKNVSRKRGQRWFRFRGAGPTSFSGDRG